MLKRVIVLIIIAHCVSLSVLCQVSDTIQIVQEGVDSLVVTTTEVTDIVLNTVAKINTDLPKDTVTWVSNDMELDKSAQKILKKTEPFKPDPTKAVLYSAIFPGLGQIYNRKYWKLPIVYGGFLGVVYAITWNGRMYGEYTDGYKAIMSDDYYQPDKSKYWTVFFPKGALPEDLEKIPANQLNTYRENIRKRRDFNRRNRDLSIISAIALYTLCMIDSYVDAQLYDFDMSPNLSFRVEPKIGLDSFSQISFGVQCSVKF